MKATRVPRSIFAHLLITVEIFRNLSMSMRTTMDAKAELSLGHFGNRALICH